MSKTQKIERTFVDDKEKIDNLIHDAVDFLVDRMEILKHADATDDEKQSVLVKTVLDIIGDSLSFRQKLDSLTDSSPMNIRGGYKLNEFAISKLNKNNNG